MKPLRDGSRAVALFNRTEARAEIAVEWSAIGLRPGAAQVRDLWAHRDLGRFTGRYAATVPPHSVVMVTMRRQPAR